MTQTGTADVNRVLVAACRTFVYGKHVRRLSESFSLYPALIESVAMDESQGLGLAGHSHHRHGRHRPS